MMVTSLAGSAADGMIRFRRRELLRRAMRSRLTADSVSLLRMARRHLAVLADVRPSTLSA